MYILNGSFASLSWLCPCIGCVYTHFSTSCLSLNFCCSTKSTSLISLYLIAGRASRPLGWSHQTRNNPALWQVSCRGKKALGTAVQKHHPFCLSSSPAEEAGWGSSPPCCAGANLAAAGLTFALRVLWLPGVRTMSTSQKAVLRQECGGHWSCEPGELRGATMSKVQKMYHKLSCQLLKCARAAAVSVFLFLFSHP